MILSQPGKFSLRPGGQLAGKTRMRVRLPVIAVLLFSAGLPLTQPAASNTRINATNSSFALAFCNPRTVSSPLVNLWTSDGSVPKNQPA
jgi:hypothetical protein